MSVLHSRGPSDGNRRIRRIKYSWIGEAWDFFKQSPGVWIVATLVFGALYLGLVFLWGAATGAWSGMGDVGAVPLYWLSYVDRKATDISISIVDLVFDPFTFACLFSLALRQVDGEVITFADIFKGRRFYVQMLLPNLILMVTSLAGSLMCCLGISVPLARLFPAFGLIVDGKKASTAMSLSLDATRADWLNSTGFVFVFWLLMAASAIPVGIGLLATFPMMFLVGAIATRDLFGGARRARPSFQTRLELHQWPPAPRVDM